MPSKMGKFLMLNCLYSAVERKTIQVIFIYGKTLRTKKNGKNVKWKIIAKTELWFFARIEICQFTVSLFFFGNRT